MITGCFKIPFWLKRSCVFIFECPCRWFSCSKVVTFCAHAVVNELASGGASSPLKLCELGVPCSGFGLCACANR